MNDDGVGEMGGEFHRVKCCRCGYLLVKELDSYAFTADGEPICYECVALGKE